MPQTLRRVKMDVSNNRCPLVKDLGQSPLIHGKLKMASLVKILGLYLIVGNFFQLLWRDINSSCDCEPAFNPYRMYESTFVFNNITCKDRIYVMNDTYAFRMKFIVTNIIMISLDLEYPNSTDPNEYPSANCNKLLSTMGTLSVPPIWSIALAVNTLMKNTMTTRSTWLPKIYRDHKSTIHVYMYDKNIILYEYFLKFPP